MRPLLQSFPNSHVGSFSWSTSPWPGWGHLLSTGTTGESVPQTLCVSQSCSEDSHKKTSPSQSSDLSFCARAAKSSTAHACACAKASHNHHLPAVASDDSGASLDSPTFSEGSCEYLISLLFREALRITGYAPGLLIWPNVTFYHIKCASCVTHRLVLVQKIVT